MNSVFYTLCHVLSLTWAWLIILIGARGRGKTYACKKWLLIGWWYRHEKFIILRDSEDECDNLCIENGITFWGDVILDKKFKDKNITIINRKRCVYINGELAGYIMPVALFYKFKGNQYQDVKRVLYDEFIREKQVRYNGDRAIQFLNTLMTVARYRNDFKIILTGNALDKGDTLISDIVGFKINEFKLYKNKSKGVVLDYIPNSIEFDKYQQSGKVYNLIKGTRYEANLIGNKFSNDQSDIYYDKKEPCDLFGIYYDRDGESIRIYESKKSDLFYCSKDFNKNTVNYMRYTFDIHIASHKIRLANNDEKKRLKELFENGLIKFENGYILQVFKNIIR